MALENLISISFTEEELQQIDSHLTALEGLLKGKCITLTPEQRKEYGRLGNRNANWVLKTVDYSTNQPTFNPVFLDKAEFDKDNAAHTALTPRFNQMEAVHNLIDDTLLILGFDLYQSALSYYKNIKMLAEKNVPGAKAIYDDLSAQFPGHSVKKASSPTT
jgi:hypothetical protein